MKKFTLIISAFISISIYSQPNIALPVKWEELTAPDFVKAVDKSGKVCIVPMGIIEKHGPHLPLATDLIIARDLCVSAAKKNYIVVFPEFYIGQIDVARPQPGTIAYSPELVWNMLEETCDEIARNGFDKIILFNWHGGNTSLVNYFAQTTLHKKTNYSLYCIPSMPDSIDRKKIERAVEKIPESAMGHAGADETAMILADRPDLVKMDKVNDQSGQNMKRLSNIPDIKTGIDWYAKYPNHYMGNGALATTEYGKAINDILVSKLFQIIQEVKNDTKVKELNDQFYKESENPLQTLPK